MGSLSPKKNLGAKNMQNFAPKMSDKLWSTNYGWRSRGQIIPTQITGVAIGGTCPLGPYSVTQNSAKMHQNTSFSHKNSKIFWGGGTAPFPDPFSIGRGHPSSYLTPQVPPLQLDPGYATDPHRLFRKTTFRLLGVAAPPKFYVR